MNVKLHSMRISMNLLTLLKGKPPAAETLRKALAETEAEAAAVETELATLRERRSALLMNGLDDKALDAVEADLNKAYRRQDRADLLIASLKERLQEAEQAERAAEADQIHAAAVTARERGFELIARYGELAVEMVRLMQDLERCEGEIRSADTRLQHRGDSRHVDGIEVELWRGREVIAQYPPWSLLGMLQLPDPEVPRRFLWPQEGRAG
jgi:chromosome segregation ATPase